MKISKINLLIGIVFIGWATIIIANLFPNVEYLHDIAVTYHMVTLTTMVALTIMAVIYQTLFQLPTHRTYYFDKGQHYPKNKLWPFRLFFYKKEITIAFELDKSVTQFTEAQINKIAGISSFMYNPFTKKRKNSVRVGFRVVEIWHWDSNFNHKLLGHGMHIGDYIHKDWTSFFVPEMITNRKKEFIYNCMIVYKIKLDKRIWLGYYNEPYIGGQTPAVTNGKIKVWWNHKAAIRYAKQMKIKIIRH